MKSKAIVSLGAIGALLLTSCAGTEPDAPQPTDGLDSDWAAVEQAAIQEGQLTIYSAASEDVMQALVAAFNEEYPQIRVSFFRATAGELLNRYASEAEAGAVAADILAPSTNPEFLEDHGYFLEMTPELIPNVADWPANFVRPHHVAVAVTSSVITYNTELVTGADVPTSWEDLLDPKFKGQGMMLDPRASDGYLSFYWLLRDHFGDEFLEQLAAQDFTLVDSGATASQEVAAGAYMLAVGNYPAHSRNLIDQGAPVDFAFDLEPTPGLTHAAGISVDAPNPNAARVYINWYLTEAAQFAACAGIYSPVGGDLEGCPTLPVNHVDAVWGLPDSERTAIYDLLGLN